MGAAPMRYVATSIDVTCVMYINHGRYLQSRISTRVHYDLEKIGYHHTKFDSPLYLLVARGGCFPKF